jgi:hypothetical protein
MVNIQNELGAIKIGLEMYDDHTIAKHSPSYEELLLLALLLLWDA